MPDSPYKISDRAIELLNKKAIRRFRAAQRNLSILGFDELNVIKVITDLYENLASDNRKSFLDLAVLVYQDTKPHGKMKGDAVFERWLLEQVLDRPNEVTKYIYTTEAQRKRERTIEAVRAAARKDKKAQMEKAMRYWVAQTDQYADIITDEIRINAFRDAGVKYVQWHTEEDERVCEICGPMDKKIYPIDEVPPKQHWRCRCWVTPVEESR